VRRVPPFKFE